jgi:hypothetical protein
MNREEILQAFHKLNDELEREGVRGEVGVVGGAAMVLAFNARLATKDVDAIFEPSTKVREAAGRVSAALALPPDWLNDAAKGYMPPGAEPRGMVLELSHLSVWVPPAEYLLAMKAISARFDTNDAADLKTLIAHLKIKSVAAVFEVIEDYYPRNQIPAKTQFFLEELFESLRP